MFGSAGVNFEQKILNSIRFEKKEQNTTIGGVASIGDNQPTQNFPIPSEKIKLCENIQIEESKGRCYFDYAQSKKDVSLCEYINDRNTQIQCKDYLNIEESEIGIYALSSYPSAVAVSEIEEVTFTVSQSGILEKAAVKVEQLNEKGEVLRMVGMLNDNGKNGDLRANDFIYSGKFMVGPYKEEQTIQYRAIFVFSDKATQPIKTNEYFLPVTNFPIESPRFDPAKVVNDPEIGGEIISNEVLVGFNKGVKPDRIRKIVEEMDGEVINVIFGLNIYQIRIPDTGDATEVYRMIKKLEKFSEVEYVGSNTVTTMDTE